jgi:hypothetical protein
MMRRQVRFQMIRAALPGNGGAGSVRMPAHVTIPSLRSPPRAADDSGAGICQDSM